MGSTMTSAVERQVHVHSSGLCWSAVIGGAFVSAALSLILLALGSGFGLIAGSPWSNARLSATAAGTAAVIWIIVVQAVSSAMGGYLAGRLRTRWTTIHNDEVHFRDTANGFLVWAVALVMTAAFLTTAAVSLAGGRAGEPGAMAATEADRQQYFVDRLFRADRTGQQDDAARAESAPIVTEALHGQRIAGDDVAWLAHLVATQTGLNQADAEKRVADTLAEARDREDAARKAAAHVLLWLFLALLIGAFCASYAATVGGRQRDRVQAVL